MTGAQPTGTVTHLFTDMQDSTKLWESYPEGMQAAMARHDALLREAIAAYRGHVVKTTGDGFHAVFAVASDALATAITGQRALQSESWGDFAVKVRMGMHSGEAEEREGDYFGPALNRAARLMSSGHGGQILLTRATRELVRDQLPADVEVIGLGKCLFEGLARPEDVFQVMAPGLPTDFPPLRTLGHRPHNLPAESRPFIGREKELAELAELLEGPEVRLVTILGAGGMGKTRLALELGARTLYGARRISFRHGVFFVRLAPLESEESIVPTVAQAISLSFHEGREPGQQLLDYLRDKQMLLILDNFEHLLNGVGWVTEVLAGAPAVKMLSTSRSRLSVQGEQLFYLSGMDVPDWEGPAGGEEFSAVQLFLQSARQVRPGFEPADEEQKHVVHICRLVDGMPLGILLAAAWVEMLTPEEIVGEMIRSLAFLETDLRDVPERQRSIQAVFDHSWNLLSEREQGVFAGLSIFRGGFLREAAQAVTGATLRDLRALVDRSLLHRASTGRYQVHELLRQYGLDKLLSSGESAALRQRHLDFYLSLARHPRTHDGQEQVDWLHRMAAEIDNLRAALDWSLSSGNAQAGLQLALYLHSLWGNLGYLSERRQWLERLLSEAQEPTLERAQGLEALGQTAYTQGDYEQALAWCEESLALSETLGDLPAIADATFRLAWPAYALGDRSRSVALLERSMDLSHQLDKPERAAFVILVMGELARAEGDLSRAKELHEQSVTVHRQLGRKPHLATALHNLGCVLIHFGELERSKGLLEESIAIELELGSKVDCQLMGFSFLARARGQPLRAARLLAASDAMRDSIGAHVDVGDRPDYESARSSLRGQLGDAAFEAARAEGEALSPEQAVALAMSDQP